MHTIRFCSVVFGVTSSLAVVYTRSIVIVYSARARLVALALKNHGDGDFIALVVEYQHKCHNLRDGRPPATMFTTPLNI